MGKSKNISSPISLDMGGTILKYRLYNWFSWACHIADWAICFKVRSCLWMLVCLKVTSLASRQNEKADADVRHLLLCCSSHSLEDETEQSVTSCLHHSNLSKSWIIDSHYPTLIYWEMVFGRGVACTRESMVACTRERLVGDSRMYTRAGSQLHANRRCAFFACKIQWKSKLVVYVLLDFLHGT
jgi:hypothetical protein